MRSKIYGLSTVITWLSAYALSTAALFSPFETVNTTNGNVIGHRVATSGDVWEYLGIPYAQPPLGQLRFAAPQRSNHTGTFNATNFVRTFLAIYALNKMLMPVCRDSRASGTTPLRAHSLTTYSDCPQQAAVQPQFPGFTSQARGILAYFTGAAGTQRSEDCLTLNIWSKETTRASQAGKPVFVLFHGGR